MGPPKAGANILNEIKARFGDARKASKERELLSSSVTTIVTVNHQD
jgi:hypothetical protein